MKIKLSKNQWEHIGKTAGWLSEPKDPTLFEEPELQQAGQVKDWVKLIEEDISNYAKCPIKLHPEIVKAYKLKQNMEQLKNRDTTFQG